MQTEIIEGQFAFTVTAEGQTSVKKLLERNGVSHRLFQKLLAHSALRIGPRPTGNKAIGKGTRVTFTLPASSTVAPFNAGLSVVADLTNWLIIDKPVGLTSVPGPANPDDSVLSRVAYWLMQQGIRGPQPAIMTRLDRDTSGLMLIAKHPFAQGLLDAVQEKNLKKCYRALITGALTPAQGTISLAIAKAADGIHREVRDDGQEAETEYETIAAGGKYSELQLTLRTGRTHQIRVHLQALGHPLVGDGLYGGDTTNIEHQLLQASELTFSDPFDRQTYHFALPRPTDWPAVQ